MSTLGERLREERQRLDLNQTEFGERGGVQKQAQINYELGKRQPDAAYLAAIAAAGADVLYILTGQDPTGLHAQQRALKQIAGGQRTPELAARIDAMIAAAAGQPSDEMAARIEAVINAADATRPLTPDEAALLDNYRHSPKEAQEAIKATSAALAKRPGLKKGKTA